MKKIMRFACKYHKNRDKAKGITCKELRHNFLQALQILYKEDRRSSEHDRDLHSKRSRNVCNCVLRQFELLPI
jgi:hypothetical protein